MLVTKLSLSLGVPLPPFIRSNASYGVFTIVWTAAPAGLIVVNIAICMKYVYRTLRCFELIVILFWYTLWSSSALLPYVIVLSSSFLRNVSPSHQQGALHRLAILSKDTDSPVGLRYLFVAAEFFTRVLDSMTITHKWYDGSALGAVTWGGFLYETLNSPNTARHKNHGASSPRLTAHHSYPPPGWWVNSIIRQQGPIASRDKVGRGCL